MRFGASTFIWCSPFGNEHLGLAEHVRSLGFDVLEVCVEDPELVTPRDLSRAATDAGIAISVCGAFGPRRDVSDGDPVIRAEGAAYLRRCIDIAAEVGAPHVAGPMYSATGKARLLSDAERTRQFDLAVEALGEAADYGLANGVGLAIEPLNRFETDLVNTVARGLDMCRAIGRSNVGLLLDTFHMNIEEKDLGDAIGGAAGRVFELHACENDRGAPGSGHVPWPAVRDALRDIAFDGLVAIESFTPEIEEIARAVSMWRPVATSGDQLASDGLSFLREMLLAPAGHSGRNHSCREQ